MSTEKTELKGFFIFISAKKTTEGGRSYVRTLLLDEYGNEFIASDENTKSSENHIYPKKENTVVYAKLLEAETDCNEKYVICNILPNGELGTNALDSEQVLEKFVRHRSVITEPEKGKIAGTFYLSSKEERSGQKGKYFELVLLNRETRITAKDFNAKSAAVPEHSVVSAILRKNDKYGCSVDFISANSELSKTEFIRHAPLDEEKMFEEITEKLRTFTENNPNSIANIALDIYGENREKILMWSAAKDMHHNFLGGLLYHTYRMMKLAENMAATYDSVNAELLLTATALHDIGKLSELETGDMGEAVYSNEGTLMGHAMLGIEMVTAVSGNRGYNKEELLLLKHCLASHHGEHEFGAVTKPAVLEAFLLHAIDLTDSRVYMYEKEYESLEPGKKTSKKVFGIDTSVYRPTFYSGKGGEE